MPLVVLRPDDAGRVAMLHAAGFPDPWRPSAFRDLLTESTSLGLGIEQHGGLVGFVLVQIAAGEADILTIATAPELKRTGIATQLMQGRRPNYYTTGRDIPAAAILMSRNLSV